MSYRKPSELLVSMILVSRSQVRRIKSARALNWPMGSNSDYDFTFVKPALNYSSNVIRFICLFFPFYVIKRLSRAHSREASICRFLSNSWGTTKCKLPPVSCQLKRKRLAPCTCGASKEPQARTVNWPGWRCDQQRFLSHPVSSTTWFPEYFRGNKRKG